MCSVMKARSNTGHNASHQSRPRRELGRSPADRHKSPSAGKNLYQRRGTLLSVTQRVPGAGSAQAVPLRGLEADLGHRVTARSGP